MMKMKVVCCFLMSLLLVTSQAMAAKSPTLRMLSTKTCPACKQMEKVLQEINTGYRGRLATDHVYLEDHPEVAKQYNVRYVPTLIFVDANGKEVAQEVGYRRLEDVIQIFKKAGINI